MGAINNFVDNVARRKVAVFNDQAAQSLVGVAGTFTGLTIADHAGKVQLNGAGVHGLTSAMETYDVYVTWSGGTGVNGFQTILTVDDVDSLTLDLAYDAGLGTPTVSLLNTAVELGRMTVPAWVMATPDAMYEIWAHCAASGTANARTVTCSTQLASWSVNTPTNNVVDITVAHKGFCTGTAGNQKRVSLSGTAELGNATNDSGLRVNIDPATDTDFIVSVTPLIANTWTMYERQLFRGTQP